MKNDSTSQWKFEQIRLKIRKLGFFKLWSIQTHWQLYDGIKCSTSICLVLKNLKFSFSFKKNFNHTCTLNIIIANMFLYSPCKEQIYIPSSITKKAWFYGILCTKQMKESSYNKSQELPICIWLITTSIIHNFLIFIQNLLKLSLTWFSYYSALYRNKLFLGVDFPFNLITCL